MENITELKRGSLNGLRRQTNECLVSAYYKGYADGKNEPNEEHEEYIRNLVNKAKQEGYDIGLEIGKKQAISEDKENEMYNKGLEDASNLIAFVSKDFIQECFPNEKDWDLFDLNAKYGLAVVIKEFKKWQEQKKQAEEFKVGDEVKVINGGFCVITKFDIINNIVRVLYNDGSGGRFDIPANECTKTGVHYDEIETLLEKLRKKYLRKLKGLLKTSIVLMTEIVTLVKKNTLIFAD